MRGVRSPLMNRHSCLGVIAFLSSAVLSSCTTLTRSQHPVVGTWRVVLNNNSCTERWAIRANGRTQNSSNLEISTSTYEVSTEPSYNGDAQVRGRCSDPQTGSLTATKAPSQLETWPLHTYSQRVRTRFWCAEARRRERAMASLDVSGKRAFNYALEWSGFTASRARVRRARHIAPATRLKARQPAAQRER